MKWKSLFIIVLLILPLLNAYDNELFINCGGDDQLNFLCIGDSGNSIYGNETISITPTVIGGSGGTTFYDKLSNISIEYNDKWIVNESNHIKVISFNQTGDRFKPNYIQIIGLEECNLYENNTYYDNITKEYLFKLKFGDNTVNLPYECNLTIKVIHDITLQEDINITFIEPNIINEIKDNIFKEHKIELFLGILIILILLTIFIIADISKRKVIKIISLISSILIIGLLLLMYLYFDLYESRIMVEISLCGILLIFLIALIIDSKR